MDSGKRKMVSIALVAVMVVAAAAVVLMSGAIKPTQYSASVTDASGQNVTMSKMPERIVSCSPAISEIVCSLGLGDQLVAVTSYDDYPAQVKALVAENHTIGGFYTPSFESVVSYNPDLVLVNSGVPSHQSLAQQLKEAGYTVMQLYPQENLDEVYKSINLVGEISGKKDKATEVISSMESRISDIGAKIGSAASQPTVMYVSYAEAGFTNVWPSGTDTAVDEIINLAGGKNVFADQSGWINPSQEELWNRAASVDCLVITSMYSGSDAENLTAFFKADSIWKNSPAVVNNKIFYLQGQGESVFNRQTVRMVDAVQLMAEMIHPDAFSSKVPNNADGVNLIGDEYANYLTQGTSSQSSSIAFEATCSRD
jgi:iron complex transport system substrate-binding protein